jgi:hypothetical protein
MALSRQLRRSKRMSEPTEQPGRPPIEYDLSAFAEHVRQTGAYPKLAGMIEKARDLGSILADLEDASRCIRMHDLILQREPSGFDVGTSAIAGSLFSYAIILYARATETSSNHRRRRFGRGWLRDGDLNVHQEALHLRNDVIAHFGRGSTIESGPMSREALVWSFIAEPEQKMLLQIYVSRTSTRLDFLGKLQPLVDHLLTHIRTLAKPAFDAVIEEIGRIASTDNGLAPALRGFPFDETAFFPTGRTRAKLDGMTSFERVELESAQVLDILRTDARNDPAGLTP